jgi:hypothetical protein
MKEKECKRCEQVLSIDNFYKDGYAKSGYKNKCKNCSKETKGLYTKKKDLLKNDKSICTKCEKVKSIDDFWKDCSKKYGIGSICKSCDKEYREENRDIILKKQSEYNKKRNKDPEYSKRQKEYKQKRAKFFKNYQKEYDREYKKKRRKDPLYRVKYSCYNRVYYAIKLKGYTKKSSTNELVGCDWNTLRSHLESLFTDGMNWDNYGDWHVDHIIPCDKFDLSKKEQQLECFNYKNLQPLWAYDNRSKYNKILSHGNEENE